MTKLYEECDNDYGDLSPDIQEILTKWDNFVDSEEEENDWDD